MTDNETQLIVNGRTRGYQHGLTIPLLIKDLMSEKFASDDEPPPGVAVAVNGSVVPRGQWPTAPISAGDRIEIVTAVQGG